MKKQRGKSLDESNAFTRRWLRCVYGRNDAAGDLIDDMRADENLPNIFCNIREMRAYLKDKGANVEVVDYQDPVSKVWSLYKTWMDRNAASGKGMALTDKAMVLSAKAWRKEPKTKDGLGGRWHPAITMPAGQLRTVLTVNGLIRQGVRAYAYERLQGFGGVVHCWARPKSGDLKIVAWKEEKGDGEP